MTSLKSLAKQIAALKKKVVSLKGESVFVAEGHNNPLMQFASLQKGAKHEN